MKWHSFSKVEFSKSNPLGETVIQKTGTNKQSVI